MNLTTTTHCIAAARGSLCLYRPVLRTTFSTLRSSFKLHHAASSARFIRAATFSHKASTRSYNPKATSRLFQSPRSRHYGTVLLAATAAGLLTPAALEKRSNDVLEEAKQLGQAGKSTYEKNMLEASRREQQDRLQAYTKNASLPKRIWRTMVVFCSDWMIEPIATTLRFLHLVVIFVPILATIPVIFIGDRVPEKSNERRGTLWWYLFLINSMERAGPTFIKVCCIHPISHQGNVINAALQLGQWAASRSDIFPTEMCDLMSRLHSSVEPHPFSETKRIVSAAFGDLPFESIFVEFDEKPLGIGAIAQVYKAKLHPSLLPPNGDDGEHTKDFRKALRHNVDVLAKSSPRQVPSSSVAVKVLHPRVEKMIHRDLRIMRFFASAINAIPTMEWLSLPDEVEKFGEMMRLQLDLRIEGNNLVKFRKNFKNRTTVTFPKPYLDYTTREVLIEEFAHGIPLSAFLAAGGGVYEKVIADMGLDAFLVGWITCPLPYTFLINWSDHLFAF